MIFRDNLKIHLHTCIPKRVFFGPWCKHFKILRRTTPRSCSMRPVYYAIIQMKFGNEITKHLCRTVKWISPFFFFFNKILNFTFHLKSRHLHDLVYLVLFKKLPAPTDVLSKKWAILIKYVAALSVMYQVREFHVSRGQL